MFDTFPIHFVPFIPWSTKYEFIRGVPTRKHRVREHIYSRAPEKPLQRVWKKNLRTPLPLHIISIECSVSSTSDQQWLGSFGKFEIGRKLLLLCTCTLRVYIIWTMVIFKTYTIVVITVNEWARQRHECIFILNVKRFKREHLRASKKIPNNPTIDAGRYFSSITISTMSTVRSSP